MNKKITDNKLLNLKKKIKKPLKRKSLTMQLDKNLKKLLGFYVNLRNRSKSSFDINKYQQKIDDINKEINLRYEVGEVRQENLEELNEFILSGGSLNNDNDF